MNNLKAFLKNGNVLCQLANDLQPGVCRKPHDTSKTKLAVSLKVSLEIYTCSLMLKNDHSSYKNFLCKKVPE